MGMISLLPLPGHEDQPVGGETKWFAGYYSRYEQSINRLLDMPEPVEQWQIEMVLSAIQHVTYAGRMYLSAANQAHHSLRSTQVEEQVSQQIEDCAAMADLIAPR